MWTGRKYDRNLSRTEIAALVRSEIKEALKKGDLPKGTKVSVRCSARGSSIYVTFTAFPYRIEDAAFVLARRGFNLWPFDPPLISRGGTDRYTPEFRAALDLVEGMLSAYNFDNSDLQTDYFNTNFYSHVDPARELTETQAQALITERAAFLEDLKVLAATLSGEQRANTIAHHCRAEAESVAVAA